MFLQNAKEIGEQKKLLCRKYGFKGVFPLDNEVELKTRAKEIGLCVSALNEALIKSCEVVVANLTPFRGPSCDVGTAYEIGLAHALDKKVFAYTNVLTPSWRAVFPSWGEEQQLVFVVLPKLKIDAAMLNPT